MDIEQILSNIYKMPPSSLKAMVSCVDEVEYPKHTFLFNEGHKAHICYFIKSGIIRAYSRMDDKEITFWIGIEGDTVLPLPMLISGNAEFCNLELLEQSVLFQLPIERLHKLYNTDIHIANWGRRYAELSCIEAEKAFIARQFKTAEERYEELLCHCPKILQRVPLGVVASYLGISQTSLSRIRAKIVL